MILTTHSMEEADVLCNRIGIVNNGVMTCLGSQEHLKEKYGGGYHMFINCDKKYHNENKSKLLRDFIKSLVPKSEMLREFNGQIIYQIPTQGFYAESFFKEMDKNKN
jgi:ATP-binding cassette subfamily A (ABC1) protein 5